MTQTVRMILLSVWFGGGVFLAAVGTPAAFAGSPDRTTAGTIAGLMLSRWHYVSLLAPAILLGLEWRDGLRRNLRMLLLAAAIVGAAAQVGVDMKLRAIRNSQPGGMSLLAPDDPTRRLFGALHGVSALLFGVQLLCGLGVLVSASRDQPPTAHARASESP